MTIRSKLTSNRYFRFTVLFLLLCLLTFAGHIISHRSFIDSGDGMRQHYKALMYYGIYLRKIVKNLVFHHTFVIPQWDFSFGEGADVFQVLHYYVIGDPFALLTIFVPARFTHILYCFITVLKIYCAGIAFIYLCTDVKKDHSEEAVLTGALVYAFSLWSLLNVQMHPFFLNPLITFPFMIAGIEKILRKEKPTLYIVSLSIAAVSNFYFLYMHILLVIIYVLVRTVLKYRTNVKETVRMILTIAGYSLISALISGVITFPALYTFLADTRTGGTSIPLFYPRMYYSELPGLFVNTNRPEWTAVGMSSITLLSSFFLFLKHKEYQLFAVLQSLCLLFLCFPFFGSLLNGLGYATNRWVWAYILLTACTSVWMWPKLMNLTDKEKKVLFLSAVFYAAICLICKYSARTDTFAGICFLVLYMAVLFFQTKQKGKTILCLVMANVVVNAFLLYSNPSSDYISRAQKLGRVYRRATESDAFLIKNLSDEEPFFRYSGVGLTVNGNMLAGVSSTEYYWSLTNPNIIEFRKLMEERESFTIMYEGDDSRTSLLALSGVRYYVNKKGREPFIPYGYQYVSETEKYEVYENINSLPLTYSYTQYVTEEEWDKKNVIEKQEEMLKGAVLEKEPADTGLPKVTDIGDEVKNISFQAQTDSAIENRGEKWIVRKAGAQMTLSWEKVPESETYVELKGLTVETHPEYDLYFDEGMRIYTEKDWDVLPSEKKERLKEQKRYYQKNSRTELTFQTDTGITTSVNYLADNDKKYADRHDFTVNLGWTEEGVSSVTITFPEIGIYTIEEINLYADLLTDFESKINALKKDTMHHMEISTNKVSGTIDLKEEKILCFSIPFTEGWTAYVDGKKADLYRTNIKYMSLVLEKGHHVITLRYHTPLLRIGLFSTMAGLLLFILILSRKKKERKNR